MADTTGHNDYDQYKYVVKAWENHFKAKHKRIPSKYDIREAPTKIRDAYKMYYKRKTELLERTLSDGLLDDGYNVFQLSESSNFGVSLIEDSYSTTTLTSGLSELINGKVLNDALTESESFSCTKLNDLKYEEESKEKRDFSETTQLESNLNAWGKNVSHNQASIESKKTKTSVKPSFKVDLKEKMFRTASFSKRNPRKLLQNTSISNGENVSTITTNITTATVTSQNSDLPDLETILTQKAKDQQTANAIASNPLLITVEKQKPTKVQLNNNWLQRNTNSNNTRITNSNNISNEKRTYGLSNININLLTASINKENEKNIETAVVFSDSDAAVLESEGEQEHRQILKRRRLMTKVNKVAAKGDCLETSSPIEMPTKPKETTVIRKSQRKILKKSAAVKTKSKRIELPEEQEEDEETPAENLDNLKTTLVLEAAIITTKPRIADEEIEAVDRLINKYINNDVTKTQPRVQERFISEERIKARKLLEQKVASGKINENYVSINLQKKRYTRGKKPMNYSKYKKKLWKSKKEAAALIGPNMDMRGCDGNELICHKCGKAGHFEQNCKQKEDNLLVLNALGVEEEDSDFMTLDQAQKLTVGENKSNLNENILDTEATNSDDELSKIDMNSISVIKDYVGHKIPQDFLIKAGLDNSQVNNDKHSSCVEPLYDLNSDGSVRPPTVEVLEALHMFGHASFRKGQDRAVMRILSGQTTLVMLSTGSGKSLCYQLPAYLYSRQRGWITLVISPLVSLMEDQVTGMPSFLRVVCLHTNQTPILRAKIIEDIGNGKVDILLISPEAVVSSERSTGFGAILRQLPPIAFACIDEVHCISQWSHNFRPSYLMICKVLRKHLGVRTVLGLTATATLPTRNSIIKHMGVKDGITGIISDTPLPNNLILSVSKSSNRDAELINLLKSERFASCQSIIIYCTRREECERIAGVLRTAMQDYQQDLSKTDTKNKKRKRINWCAEPYHAGMASARRLTVQKAFMSNELRIVVATVAFGMGINKPDIRAIIHYNMPRNFESYVQEIGRAGRDGQPAQCHAFLDANGADQFELRRHIYANSIDRHVIRKLLQHVFVSCSCVNNNAEKERSCEGHEVGFSHEDTVMNLDLPVENISTLLCYLELDIRWNIQVLGNSYTKARIISYGGAKYLKQASSNCPPLAMAIALQIKNGSFDANANTINFSIIDIAAAIGWNSGVVKHHLKNLEWTTLNGRPKRTSINVTFHDLGFRLHSPGNFTDAEIDEALNMLYSRSVQQEQTQLMQLQYTYHSLSVVSFQHYLPCTKLENNYERSEQLKSIIRDYFEKDFRKNMVLEKESCKVADDELVSQIHGMLNLYPENEFTGRNIARIFHGISSPKYPAVMWSRCKYWRSLIKVDFNRILQLANEVIVKRRY